MWTRVKAKTIIRKKRISPVQNVNGNIPYFSDYKMHFFPKIWEENGGGSYSPNVAYLAHWWVGGGSGVGSLEAGAGPHFLFQNFFSYFPPLKPRWVLWSGVSYSLKNTVVAVVEAQMVWIFLTAKAKKKFLKRK